MNKRLFIFACLVIIAIIAMISQLFFGKNSLSHQRRVAREIAVYQAKIDSLEKQIEIRNLQIERLKGDSLYKAEILRTRYGMSQKDAKVFQLVKEK